MPSESRRKLIVAGLIVRDDGAVLITQRRADQPHAMAWEFPGGKIEPGESPVQALARELGEEIGVEILVRGIWDVLHHDYGDFEIVMLIYHCELAPGQEARCVEVHDLAWCQPAALGSFAILPADQPLVARLAREGAPRWPRSVDPK